MRHYKSLLFGATGLMATSLTLGTLGGAAAWASSHGTGGNGGNQPPGNNGTVKVDEYTVDSGQDNDPHVSCGFTVSFYGYDGGTQNASISITPVAPTAGGRTFTKDTNWTTSSRTGGNQLDQQVPISGAELSSALTGVTPQAQQGYHLRLEVEVTGSQGSDDKYKVFWMQPCPASGPSGSPAGAPANTPSTSRSSSGTPAPTGPSGGGSGTSAMTSGGATVASAGSSVASTSATKTATLASGSAPASSTPAAVAPAASLAVAAPAAASTGAAPAATAAEVSSAPADAAGPFAALSGDQSAAVPSSGGRPSGGSLAFTGASIGALVALGLGLITAGLLLTRRWRRVNA